MNLICLLYLIYLGRCDMYLFRALNEYDVFSNPLKNGIGSKVLINDLAKKCYENDKFYKSLGDKEKEWYIKEHVIEYLNNYNYKLAKLFDKNSKVTREDVLEYRKFLEYIKGLSVEEVIELVKCNRSSINFGSYIKFMKYLSTLQSHLLYGSTKETDWISTSTDIN